MDKVYFMKLAEKINKVIDKELRKVGLDRAYFEFKVKVNILNNSFEKVSEIDLIDDEMDYHYCAFCRAPAYYFVSEIEGYVCAGCYAKLKQGNCECQSS